MFELNKLSFLPVLFSGFEVLSAEFEILSTELQIPLNQGNLKI